jgi:hypothetical protein
MAGIQSERQEKGLVDAINKAVKENQNNPVTLIAGKETIEGVTGAEKFSGRQLGGAEPYTDVVIYLKNGQKYNLSCKGETAPSLAGGGLRGIEIAVPGLGKKFMKQAYYAAVNKLKLRPGDPVPNMFGSITLRDTVKIVVGTTSMGGPIDYMYIGPMNVTSQYDEKTNVLTLNGKLFESYAYAKSHKLYLRLRARREDQRFDPDDKDSTGSPRIYGRSPSKKDLGGRIVLVDEKDVPNSAIIVRV